MVDHPNHESSICGKCGKSLHDEDRYCRHCGTKRGEGTYNPSHSDFSRVQCIYGPAPIEREHRCTRCGYTWTTLFMIDDEAYCPICGGESRLLLAGEMLPETDSRTLCLRNENTGHIDRFRKEEVVVGGDPHADLWTPSSEAADRIAVFTVRDGVWYMTVYAEGCRLNDMRTRIGQTYELKRLDAISFTRHMRYRIK